ncbi:hypothetical protein, conserved [Eimeria praecox]|uniref:Uncharacterized protein n=1 Tax=Eimeria praecox TaxID=51316 RepID=U6G300_9EIME|nr:hypothetical protein, conserved [Eimeria praecox]
MPSCAAGFRDHLRTPFTVSLQRGTTIIRCTPPKAIIDRQEENKYSKYYNDVNRRRAPMPSLFGDSRNREPSRTPSHPLSEANSQYSPGLEAEKGDEDSAPVFALPEPPVSPKVVVDWGQAGPSSDGQEPASDDEPKRTEKGPGANHLTDERVIRGYIGIAYALLRHFEEALGTRQRLTAGSLECAETVCSALNAIQDSNPRLQLLTQRIATAIGLLHRRKTLEDQDAAERGVLYGDVTVQRGTRQQRRIAGLPTPKIEPVHDKTKDMQADPEGPLGVAPSPSRQFAGEVERHATSVEGTAIAVPPGKRVDVWLQGSGALAVAGVKEGMPCTPSTGASSLFLGTEQRLKTSAVEGSSCERFYSAVEPTGKLAEDQVFLFPSSARTRGPQSTDGLPTTHLVGPHAGRESSSANQSHRVMCPAIPFRESEGNLHVRPLVLSEIHVLGDKDKGSSQCKQDPNNASATEALALIRCAEDLIVSGEGPGFVEKQFFRYFRSDSYQAEACRPHIPEGMKPAQGKYLLLRYAIAKVEDEYGKEPTARGTHLYLRDLRRMEEIIVNTEPAKALTVVDSHSDNEGKESECLQSAQKLPERSPEERMERRLPLTILSLPSSAPRQDARQPHREASPPLHPPVHSEGSNRVSPGLEFLQPTPVEKENSPRSNSRGTSSPLLDTMSLPKPLPSLGRSGQGFEELVTAEQPTGSSTEEVRQPSRALSSSSVSTVLAAVPSLPDVPTAVAGRESETSNSHTSSRQVSLPTPPLARASSSASSAQSTALSGLLALRRDSSSCGKLCGKSQQSEGGDRSKLLMPKGSLDSILIGEKGLKLSNRSIVRDSVSGEVTSVVFEAPNNPAGQSILDAATFAAMKGITTPRSPGLSLASSHADEKTSL